MPEIKAKLTEKEFEKLLEEKENKDIDFKLELPESNKVAQLVTALYNGRGGKIIIGVADETRKPVGLADAQKTENKFTQIIRHWCRLDEEPEIEFVKYKNKDFIVVHCPKGKDTPYFVRGEHTPRVRIGSSSMPANKGKSQGYTGKALQNHRTFIPLRMQPLMIWI